MCNNCAGTGQFTQLLIDSLPENGEIFAVEPSAAMRTALVARLATMDGDSPPVTVLPDSALEPSDAGWFRDKFFIFKMTTSKKNQFRHLHTKSIPPRDVKVIRNSASVTGTGPSLGAMAQKIMEISNLGSVWSSRNADSDSVFRSNRTEPNPHSKSP